MKVVLDTNVWLSAIFWTGEANKIVKKAEEKKFEIIISQEILSEIVEILNREQKFENLLENKKQRIEDVIKTILHLSILKEPKEKISVIKDESDNKFLEVALSGKANYILSYDNHLLELNEFRGIKIIHPTEFL